MGTLTVESRSLFAVFFSAILWAVCALISFESLASEEALSSEVVQDVLKAVFENDNQSLVRLIAQTNGEVVNVRVVINEGGAGEGLLVIAAAEGSVDIVRTLLSHGADVNSAGYGGIGALDHAAVYCNSKLAKLLIMSGADLNKKDNLGVTPLMSSAIIGCKDVLIELLNHGADTDIESNEGRTALDYAKIKGWAEIIEILGKRGKAH